MHRIISLLSVAMLTGATAFAAPTISTKDFDNNIITITDSANDGDIVSLVVANHGFDTSDIITLPESALQFFDSTEAVDGSYSFDVRINNEIGNNGTYSAIVNVAGVEEKFTFTFYSIDVKLDIIDEINSASSISDLLKRDSESDESIISRAIKVYGLNSLKYGNDVNIYNFAEIVFKHKNEGYDNDATFMYDFLRSSIYLTALNDSSEKAFENNILSNPELLAIETDSNIWKDYTSNLSSKGIKSVRIAMSDKKFTCIDEAYDAFEDSVILNLFINNAKYGNGQVPELLEMYKAKLEGAGFKLNRLNSVKNKSDLYDELSSAKATSLSELATIFNKFDDNKNTGNGGGSSGSGGLNYGSMTSDTGSLPTYISSESDVVTAISFTDIESVPWAQEAIEVLSKRGIVNGKGNYIFDPNGAVTRAEFAKMIVGAAGILDNNAECTFKDVTSHWAYKYIASAFKNGIVSGTDENIFSPDSAITREQGATIIYRTLVSSGNQMSADANSFSDNDMLSDWALEAVNALSAEGIINGKGDNMFAPKDTLTRAEAAKIIYSTMNLFLSEQEG